MKTEQLSELEIISNNLRNSIKEHEAFCDRLVLVNSTAQKDLLVRNNVHNVICQGRRILTQMLIFEEELQYKLAIAAKSIDLHSENLRVEKMENKNFLMNTLRKKILSKGKWLISIEFKGSEASAVTNNSIAIDAAFGDFEEGYYTTQEEARQELINEII